MKMWKFSLTTIVILLFVDESSQHGYLAWPPQRSSLWRHNYDTPINYNDNSLWCGGISYFREHGGKCGICGDPLYGPHEHLAGGKYALGIIGATYPKGTKVINAVVRVDAFHRGYFEFKICSHNNPTEHVKQSCLDENPLQIEEGDPNSGYKRYYPKDNGNIELKLLLPAKQLYCTQCVLQWKYVAGNSWGTNSSGHSCLGCGIQETFQNCADISIGHRELAHYEQVGETNSAHRGKHLSVRTKTHAINHRGSTGTILQHRNKTSEVKSKTSTTVKKRILNTVQLKKQQISKESNAFHKNKPMQTSTERTNNSNGRLTYKFFSKMRQNFIFTIKRNKHVGRGDSRTSASARSTLPYTITVHIKPKTRRSKKRILTKFNIGETVPPIPFSRLRSTRTRRLRLKISFFKTLMAEIRKVVQEFKKSNTLLGTSNKPQKSTRKVTMAMEKVIPKLMDEHKICGLDRYLCKRR